MDGVGIVIVPFLGAFVLYMLFIGWRTRDH